MLRGFARSRTSFDMASGSDRRVSPLSLDDVASVTDREDIAHGRREGERPTSARRDRVFEP